MADLASVFPSHNSSPVVTPKTQDHLSKLKRLLALTASALERSAPLCVLLITINFIPLTVLEANSLPLSNDEIYTVHIAETPSLRAMMALSREIDLHPPLHYIVQREALRLPLSRRISARLPSILAGLIACFALFRFASLRFGNLIGLTAVAVFWFGPALDFAWSNRPYMIWLALLCLMMLMWVEASRENRSRWSLVGIFLIVATMACTHLFGIACVLPFALAEFARGWKTRRLDWPLLFAMSLPTLIGVEMYYQLHHFGQNSFPTVQLPSIGLASGMYWAMIENAFAIISGCTIVAALIYGRPTTAQVQPTAKRLALPEAVLLWSLVLLPVLLMVVAWIFKVQFWFRYAAAAFPAVALLGAWAIARRLPFPRALAVMVVACSAGYMVHRMIIEPTNATYYSHAPVGGRARLTLATLDSSVPIVTASPMTFVEMSDREPLNIADRTYYLIDRKAALKYSGYTLFENEDKIRDLLQLPSKTDAFQHFVDTHQTFYMIGDYGRLDTWLPRKLADDGFHLDYMGKFASTYESDDLYRVSR